MEKHQLQKKLRKERGAYNFCQIDGEDIETLEDFSTVKGSDEKRPDYGGIGYDAPTIMKF